MKICDERLEYIQQTGNTRGRDAQEMARELLALRKAFSEPVAWNNFRWVETPRDGWHWSLYEKCQPEPKFMKGWASLPMFYKDGYESLLPPTDITI